jgi:hypothetical protein
MQRKLDRDYGAITCTVAHVYAAAELGGALAD